IKAFISAILGWDPRQKSLDPGILGVVKGYDGCVEAQGRGTLHCHMLVRIQGSLDPQQIKDQVLNDKDYNFQNWLLAFLDDTILTSIPDPPSSNVHCLSENFHPCSVRCSTKNHTKDQIEKDLHLLVSTCQVHKHTNTCYKYFKGPGKPLPKDCHFDMSPENTNPSSYMDNDTGELKLRISDGMVNNFCETIIRALHCNMDIKFIGSGKSAKAILYYITDYITKSQLKTHVAYAALQAAVKKLQERSPSTDPIAVQAKKLLVKCANSLISKQELSAQQVASYLLGHKDYYTSHSYRSLYWTSFNGYLNKFFSNSNPEPQDSDMSDVDGASAEDEVTLSTDARGNITALGSQLMDYIYRDDSL
ncbi:hypothetical protein BS47DRAFT_1272692, partial [Hydnum rufescens UP504]